MKKILFTLLVASAFLSCKKHDHCTPPPAATTRQVRYETQSKSALCRIHYRDFTRKTIVTVDSVNGNWEHSFSIPADVSLKSDDLYLGITDLTGSQAQAGVSIYIDGQLVMSQKLPGGTADIFYPH